MMAILCIVKDRLAVVGLAPVSSRDSPLHRNWMQKEFVCFFLLLTFRILLFSITGKTIFLFIYCLIAKSCPTLLTPWNVAH